MSSSRDFFEIAGIFCLSLILFTWGVNAQEVIGFESRFYLFALEMWRAGPSWFPTAYHHYYPDYPGTSTLLIYLVASILGSMNKLAAVFPSAVAASLSMVFTYLIGALRNKFWGLYAVLFLLLTVIFLKTARTITLDMYLTMITAACFYIAYSADIKDMHSRESLIYFLFALGFAFRGPIGLIIPAGVVCTYYLQDANFKRLIVSGAMALLVLVLCTFLLLAIAHFFGGHEFVHNVLRMEVFGRIDSHAVPIYFYFTQSITDYALSFPFACIVAVGVIYYEQRLHYHTPELKLLLKLIGWILVIMIGMSIPGDKKIRYILPITPAIALLSSYLFIAPKGERYFYYLKWFFIRFFLIFPIILFIGVRMAMSYVTRHDFHVTIYYLLITQILFAMLACGILVFVLLSKRPKWRETGILSIATFSFVMTYLIVIEPIQQYMDKAKVFVLKVEAARKHNHANLVFYKEKYDGLPIKYLINMPDEELPQFIDNEDDLMLYQHSAFFITSESYFKQLSPVSAGQLHVIARDKIGHVPVVVFTNR